MEAYVDEMRKLEERFEGIKVEHVPRVENDIADYLSKHAAFKLPVEPGTFVLRLTQPSVEPSTDQNKRRKSGPGKYFPTEPPGAAAKKVPKINTKDAEGQSAPASSGHPVTSMSAAPGSSAGKYLPGPAFLRLFCPADGSTDGWVK